MLMPPQPPPGQAPAADQLARCQQCATRSLCLMGWIRPSHAQLLASAIAEQPIQKGEILQRQGDVAATIAIIKLGTVVGSRRGTDGSERPVALFSRGQLMGAYGLLGQRCQLSARALSPGRVCEVSIADLYRLGVMDRQFLGCVYSMISAAFGVLADWAQVVRVKGVQWQVLLALHLLAREHGNPVIRLPSHVALAELLSTTRETIARSLQQLEKQGLIHRIDRWHCQVLHMDPHNVPSSVLQELGQLAKTRYGADGAS